MRNSILLIQQTLFNLSLLKAKRNTTDHNATKNVWSMNFMTIDAEISQSSLQFLAQVSCLLNKIAF